MWWWTVPETKMLPGSASASFGHDFLVAADAVHADGSADVL
jgi:hypothetical protein